MKFFRLSIFLFLISNLCFATTSNIYVCNGNTIHELMIEGGANFNNCKSTSNIIINGNIVSNNSNFNDTLVIIGRSNLLNSTVFNGNFYGQLIAKFAYFSNLYVTENAFIHEVVINKYTQIFGNLFADNTIFHDNTEIFGLNNTIKNSLINKNIILKENLNNSNQQILTLENTIVSGNIIIENKNSKINITKNSSIKGEIINNFK